ncbi:MAG: archaetidylserine decarboxylase [Polyangiaceae bacterium]
MSVATFAAAQLLRVLPRVRITRAVGRLADAAISASVSSAVVGIFSRAYSVDLDEAIHPEGGFESFDAFFTRRLREGARAIHAPSETVVSPADGRLEAIGPITSSGRFQIKGRDYRADELLGSTHEATRYEGGSFAVIYLSPRDYHRVHAPVGGEVRAIRSMPGDLFPVNAIGERHVRSLFSINRRVAIPIDSPTHGRVTVVMVGAMIVGRITVPMLDHHDVEIGTHTLEPAYQVERAGEIGVFHLGSTAVVFTEPSVPSLHRELGPIRLGEPLNDAARGSAG